MAIAATAGAEPGRRITREERKVIIASSVGTVFEWYDFYLAGALAVNISAAWTWASEPAMAIPDRGKARPSADARASRTIG